MIIVTISEIIHPQSVIKVEGEGMVVEGWNTSRGNLYIKFDIVFPEFINLENKEIIKKALDPQNNK